MIYHLLSKKNAYFYISICEFLNICLLKKSHKNNWWSFINQKAMIMLETFYHEIFFHNYSIKVVNNKNTYCNFNHIITKE